jgi:hypothetical protein
MYKRKLIVYYCISGCAGIQSEALDVASILLASKTSCTTRSSGGALQNSAKTVPGRGRGNPDKTKPFRWKKGESGNPAGRPPIPEEEKLPITAALRRAINEGKISADDLATSAVALAKKNPRWFAEVCDRIEGKPKQRVEVSGVEAKAIPVSIADIEGRIIELLERARSRANLRMADSSIILSRSTTKPPSNT